MNQNQRRKSRRNRPRAVSFAAAITEEEDLTMRRPRPGLGRVFFVVLLMHIIAIAGIMTFNWLGNEEAPAEQLENAVAEEQAIEDQTDVGATTNLPRRASGRAIVVDHPDPEFKSKGYKRYRVAINEQLAHIAREFNVSVAKLEQINGFRTGERLYAGQWITVVDKRGVTAEDPNADPAAAEVALQDPTQEPLAATPIDPTAPAADEPPSLESVVENRSVHERLTEIDPTAPPASPQPRPNATLTPIEPTAQPQPQPAVQPQPLPQPQPYAEVRPLDQPYQPAPQPLTQPQPAPQFQPQPQPQPLPQTQPQPQIQPQQPVRRGGNTSPIWEQNPGRSYQPQPQPQPQVQPQYATQPQQPPRAMRTYQVVSGDTAFQISRRFGVSVQDILQANGMNDARQLQAGQLIRIP